LSRPGEQRLGWARATYKLVGGSAMRLSATLFAVVAFAVVAVADEKDTKPITPADAAKMVDKKVTVEMEVKSVGKAEGVYFLNSEEDFKSEKNFTIFINQEGTKKFKEAKVEDMMAHFKGKTVRVTGTVQLYKEKPEIVVEDPKQIEVVEKKKD
jgi:DNA/RNA endonuclease YhcR with UshA esterase domain